MGIRDLARFAFEEVTVTGSTDADLPAVIQAFWEHWHQTFDQPRGRVLVGSPRPTPLEDVSPWQENAIRAWEDTTVEVS